MINVKSKPKVLVVLGPTASGKSDAAIKLAKKFNGEVISADSRQVYRGMDIGSGKVKKDFAKIFYLQFLIFNKKNYFFSEGIRHYLIDIVEPVEEFNISHFKKQAEEAIEKILAKGKLPIICGGTGFWIQSVTDNMSLPKVKPNEQLRNELNSKPAEELFKQLQELDPKRAENIDRNNNVRLIRAIEIASELGKVPSKESVTNHQSSVKYDFLQIGIEVPREILNAKIKNRLEDRFQEGMIKEVEKLNKKGVSWERLESFGLEYRWIARYLQSKVSLDEMKERLYYDIIHYAKRQMTWFKRNKKILWKENYNEIEIEVEKFLK